jgi:hypothetical protein
MVIWLHLFPTELQIFGKTARPVVVSAAKLTLAKYQDQSNAMDIKVANYVKKFYNQATYRPFGVNNVCVKLLDLSVGV